MELYYFTSTFHASAWMPHRHLEVHASPTQLTASDPASVLERSAICICGVSSRPPSHHTCSASYTTPCCPCPMSPPAPCPLSPGPLPSPLTGLPWASSQQSARHPPETACETHSCCCHWPLGGPSRALLPPPGPSHTGLSNPHHVALALSPCRLPFLTVSLPLSSQLLCFFSGVSSMSSDFTCSPYSCMFIF